MAKYFGKLLVGAFAGAALTCIAPAASAQNASEFSSTTSVETVRGLFTGACERDRSGGEYYTYRLAGQIIEKLTSECVVGRMSFVNAAFVNKGQDATVLVIHEAMAAAANMVHIINIPATGKIGLISTTGEVQAFHKNEQGTSHIQIGNSGYAGSGEGRAEWTCDVDVNFARKAFKSKLEEPHEIGLTQDVCAMKLEEIAI